MKRTFIFSFTSQDLGNVVKTTKTTSHKQARRQMLMLSEYQYVTSDFRKKKNTLHLLISSDKSDYDAHWFMMKIINDSTDQSVVADMDLLTLALTNVKSSRLLCIIEIILQLNKGSKKREILSGSYLVELLNTCPMDKFWELELGVRICIVLAYKKMRTLRECVKTKFAGNNCHFRKLFEGRKIAQTEMARFIKLCIEECHKSLPSNSENTFDMKQVRFGGLICRELIKALKSSLHITLQSKIDDFY